MRLVWAQCALEDRRAIFDYIEAEDVHAAVMVDERIAGAVIRLIDFPESGRLGRVFDTRELVVPHTSFVIAYRITGEVVRILRVLHGAQLWPGDIPG